MHCLKKIVTFFAEAQYLNTLLLKVIFPNSVKLFAILLYNTL